MDSAEMKHKVRQLKNLERRLRYGQGSLTAGNPKDGTPSGKLPLLWEEYFDLSGNGQKKARYSIDQLLRMDKDQYKSIVNEYFFQVYYRIYQERGLSEINLYDPDLLSQLGLPFDADSNTVKKRFRELAKQYHPDTGGDSEEFIRLMELYQDMKKMEE